MPYRNRVTPAGQLIAVPARGALMGNRGTLHNSDKQVVKETDRTAWIYCALEYQDRKQEVLAPGKYTQLFFLDEATALAAGHRPCARCKREAYNRFVKLFYAENGVNSIGDSDKLISQQRGSHGLLVDIHSLPDGAFISHSGESNYWLVWGDNLYEWAPEGYVASQEKRGLGKVKLITPASIVDTLAAGYRPFVHESVSGGAPSQSLANKPKSHPQNSLQPTDLHKVPNDLQRSVKPMSDLLSYKLVTTPSGKELYAYFAAILHETGMIDGEVYNLKRFMGNFSGHIDAGRILKVAAGYQVSDSGKEYFLSRHAHGSRQYVDPVIFESMRRGLRSGGAGWIEV